MSSTPITAELREYVVAVRAYHLTDTHGKKREYVDTTTRELLKIAYHIDAEYERRMDDCRREVVRCSECIFAHPRVDGLMQCDITRFVNHENFYCANGARREVSE